MKYKIELSNRCKKRLKKLDAEKKEIFREIVEKLANNEVLDPKYHDHALKGEYVNFRECHLKPDLLLIYQKQDDKLILYCLNVGSHSDLFA